MSIATSNRVWQQSRQSGSGLLILLALADRADDDGYCWPGINDIATRARLDPRQTRRVLKRIEDAGELYAQRFGGRGRTNEYIVAVGQTTDEIARTLVRRFEMSMSAATETAAIITEKGDISAQKGVCTPPFNGYEKGDIQGEKGVQKPGFTSAKGDTGVKRVTPVSLKGGLHTPRTIINQRKEEDILSSPPVVAVSSAPETPEAIWQSVLDELANSMPTQTFDMWIRDTNALSCKDGEFVIGVPHAYARDWLQNRLTVQTQRTLTNITKQPATVTFAVRPQQEI